MRVELNCIRIAARSPISKRMQNLIHILEESHANAAAVFFMASKENRIKIVSRHTFVGLWNALLLLLVCWRVPLKVDSLADVAQSLL